MTSYNPSERERHMISIGLTSMRMMLEKELLEVTGGDSHDDHVVRTYLEERIEHYRVLAAMYEGER